MDYLIFSVLGYLLGSLPFGLVAGRLLKGVDVRHHGSGSIGMTNVWRTVGVPAAVAVLALDMGKAVLAVLLAKAYSELSGVEVAAALAALVGHIWPVFSGFRGGKGTAPGWGGLFILSPVSGLIGGAIGVSTIVIWRYASLGSLLGATSGAVVLILLAVLGPQPLEYVLFSMFGVPLILLRHKDNIRRLIRGEERKMGQRTEDTEGPSSSERSKGMRWPRSV